MGVTLSVHFDSAIVGRLFVMMPFCSVCRRAEATKEVFTYIGLFGLDVVEGEESVAVADAALPPLPFLLRHQDGVIRAERQVTRLGAFIGVQRHVNCCEDKHVLSTLFYL